MSGESAIAALGYVGLAVSDLAVWRRFATLPARGIPVRPGIGGLTLSV
jgi:hypothetical protein